jgi:ribosomal protein L44E
LSAGVFPALQPNNLADRKFSPDTPSKEAAVRFRCDNCHHEIKQTPIIEARRKFCDGRCGDHWKRRMLRLQATQKPASN